MGVVKTAVELAKYWNVDEKKARIAALFHDIGRQFNTKELLDKAKEYKVKISRHEIENPLLLHSKVAVKLIKRKYGIKDKSILRAVLYHTTGTRRMTKLEKIIYLADYVEPGRKFKGVGSLRKLAFKNLNKAVAKASKLTLKYLKSRKISIHPKTLECYLGHKER